MKSIPILRLLNDSFRNFGHRSASSLNARPGSVHRNKPAHKPRIADPLEPRVVLSAGGLPTVTMLDASTADSKSVAIEYRVTPTLGSDSGQPLAFGVYRSADATFDASDVAVSGASSVRVSYDSVAAPAAAEGTHRVTIPLPDGLPIDPTRPYVLVVANPESQQATSDPTQAAAFRKYTIGVVTHGGIQNTSWKNGPPWQLQIGHLMRQQGYDAVIPYNWVRESSTPGASVKQGPRLANLILKAAAGFDSSDPVDLHLVGHSQGAVINTIALVRIEKEITPQIAAGYVQDTLLDPHAATNNTPGQDRSTASSILGGIAEAYIKGYQDDADDPQVFIPAIVDDAQVFYQHTSASVAGSLFYNLWGQVPIANAGPETHYYNLTAMGATHSGKKGVQTWYLNFIAPTLDKQTPLIHALKLDGVLSSPSTLDTSGRRPVRTINGDRATFSGTATPGALVRLYTGPYGDPTTIDVAGRTTADSNGQWSITTLALPVRQYRAVAMSFSRELRTRPGLAVVPMATLGTFRVDAGA